MDAGEKLDVARLGSDADVGGGSGALGEVWAETLVAIGGGAVGPQAPEARAEGGDGRPRARVGVEETPGEVLESEDPSRELAALLWIGGSAMMTGQ